MRCRKYERHPELGRARARRAARVRGGPDGSGLRPPRKPPRPGSRAKAAPWAESGASQQKLAGTQAGGASGGAGLLTGGRGPRCSGQGLSGCGGAGGGAPHGGARGGDRWGFRGPRRGLCLVRGASASAPARGGGFGRAGGLHPPGRPRARASQFPEPGWGLEGVVAAAPLPAGRLGAGPGRAESGGGAGRRIARRAVAWTGRAMAAPELVPRRGREREREDESEDESDILEESPCGRWQKRREQVGTPGRGGSPPTLGGGVLGPRGAVRTLSEPGGREAAQSLAQTASSMRARTPLAWPPRPGEKSPLP